MSRQAIINATEERANAASRHHAPDGIPLRIENVSKVFPGSPRAVQALQPINLEVAAGEFVCLLGPSGCGKSTLLNIVAGLDAPSTGTVWANEQEVRGPGTERVMLFQEAALFPWLDVQRNVEFGLSQMRIPATERHSIVQRFLKLVHLRGFERSFMKIPAKERRRIAQHFIELVHLKGFERSFVHQLSGGMRQRVAIARALAINPALLLMDEPFGALDALTRDRLHAELESIWAETNKTVLFVTHNAREAVALGDRVLVFSPRPGRIVRDVRIDLPRPRSLEDHALVDIAADLLEVLRDTMEQDEQHEQDEVHKQQVSKERV